MATKKAESRVTTSGAEGALSAFFARARHHGDEDAASAAVLELAIQGGPMSVAGLVQRTKYRKIDGLRKAGREAVGVASGQAGAVASDSERDSEPGAVAMLARRADRIKAKLDDSHVVRTTAETRALLAELGDNCVASCLADRRESVWDRLEEISAVPAANRAMWIATWASDANRQAGWLRLKERTETACKSYRRLTASIKDVARRVRITSALCWQLHDVSRLPGMPGTFLTELRTAVAAADAAVFSPNSVSTEGKVRAVYVHALNPKATAHTHRQWIQKLVGIQREAANQLRQVCAGRWPELNLRLSRAVPVAEVRIRQQLKAWGFTDAEMEAARALSPVLQIHMQRRSLAASRQARRRAKKRAT